MNWLKKLFGMMDRSDAAAERIATALEDVATDLERARDAIRSRLGIREIVDEVPDLPSPAAHNNGNGHAKRLGRSKVTT